MYVEAFLWAVLGPEDSQGFHFEWDGGMASMDEARESRSLSWNWRVERTLGFLYPSSHDSFPSGMRESPAL